MRRLTSAVCVVALGVGTAGRMATGNENAMALGTLGTVAGGIIGTKYFNFGKPKQIIF